MQAEPENGPPQETEPLRFDPIPGEDWFFETMRKRKLKNTAVARTRHKDEPFFARPGFRRWAFLLTRCES